MFWLVGSRPTLSLETNDSDNHPDETSEEHNSKKEELVSSRKVSLPVLVGEVGGKVVVRRYVERPRRRKKQEKSTRPAQDCLSFGCHLPRLQHITILLRFGTRPDRLPAETQETGSPKSELTHLRTPQASPSLLRTELSSKNALGAWPLHLTFLW